ncbi:MAG: helix-turn-helix domain-containing protein [Ignavibacteria bacterium]
MNNKSLCPINQALEIFGDKWTLLIIRDILFNGKNTYRDFLQSEEKIASNILADRLVMLEKEGLLVKKTDPGHKQKIIYTLTEKGIDLLPVLFEIGAWSAKYKTLSSEDKTHLKKLRIGGEKLQKDLKKKFLLKLNK